MLFRIVLVLVLVLVIDLAPRPEKIEHEHDRTRSKRTHDLGSCSAGIGSLIAGAEGSIMQGDGRDGPAPRRML